MEAISAVAIEVEDLDDVRACSRPPPRPSGWTGWSSTASSRIAYEWCVRHPATAESGTATWGDAGLPGLGDCDASLGGEGTPGVAPFVAEELGAAMGISTQSAMALMADALDLRHRFPLLWAKVEDLATSRRGRPVGSPPTPARCRSRRPAGWTQELAARVDGFGLPDHRTPGRPGRGPVRAGGAGREGAGSQVPAARDADPPAARRVRRHLLARGRRRHQGPDRLLRASSATWPSSSAGSVTPTTTRPARPRPSASSPASQGYPRPHRRGTAGRPSRARRRAGEDHTSTSTSRLADLATHLGGGPGRG